MRWLDERGIGVPVGPVRVPIVPAAVLFDLTLGDSSIRPDANAGYTACVAASTDAPAEGNVGAGAGAVVGKLFGFDRAMKGGIGAASVTVDGITVGAIVAVNAAGDVIDPASGRLVAGARSADGLRLHGSTRAMLQGELPTHMAVGAATTLGVVATDAVITKSQANKIAQMAHDGLARSINPVHTQSDGDTLFALGTGESGRTANITVLGTLAAEVVAQAVLSAVRAAESLPSLPACRDITTNGDSR
jgi:L-aminopeptidase/D-esterase-like protein